MPGDEWQQFANLRLLFGYMWAHPGKKLLFMGGEFGQRREWQHEESLEWHVLGYPLHEGVREWVADLNRCYRAEPALHDFDCERGGFEWIDANDRDNSVLSFVRRNLPGDEVVLVVLNFTPVVRSGYGLGVPRGGRWEEILNSDSERYGGSGVGNLGGLDAQPHAAHGRDWSLRLTLPPLSALFFKSKGRA
jgi:1,4-alpha-glucan branching enzyme